jgi:hypothetical protein
MQYRDDTPKAGRTQPKKLRTFDMSGFRPSRKLRTMDDDYLTHLRREAERSARDAPTFVKNLQDLQHRHFGKIKWVLENMIPEGLTLIVGPPKLGKSIIAMMIAFAMKNGSLVLGEKCPAGEVLLLALEDNDRRLHSRASKMLNGSGFPNIDYELTWPRIDQGGLDKLERWLELHEGSKRVVIIDVLQRVRAIPKGNLNRYEADYIALMDLHKLCQKYKGLSIIVFHHDRKARSDEAFDLISGTQGLAGAADTVVVMQRQRWGASVFIRGRDLEEEIDIGMKLNPETLQWEFLGTTDECRVQDVRRRILHALTHPMSPKEVAVVLELKYENVRQIMYRMAEKGLLMQGSDKKYEKL